MASLEQSPEEAGSLGTSVVVISILLPTCTTLAVLAGSSLGGSLAAGVEGALSVVWLFAGESVGSAFNKGSTWA